MRSRALLKTAIKPMKSWGRLDLNQRIRKESDLQSDAIDRYATPPKECWRKELNPQPFDYKSNALPIELLQLKRMYYDKKKNLFAMKNLRKFRFLIFFFFVHTIIFLCGQEHRFLILRRRRRIVRSSCIHHLKFVLTQFF